MGVMTKMRESTGVILWILVLSFGGLWVLQDSGALDNIGMQQRQNIAVINGEPIPYQEYTRALEQEVRAYQQRTGEPAPQAVRDQYADVIYDRLVEDRLREEEMDRLGIRVTDAEVRAMFTGPTPDPIILQLFPDGQGGVDRAQLQSVIDSPEATQDLIAIEEYLRSKRRAEKLNALLAAAVRVTDADVDAAYVLRNQRARADYVALRYAAVPDSAVTVTERDLKAFYDANREDFKRERTATIDFVSLSQEPSPEDSAAVMNDLARLRADFASATDDSLFVSRNFSQTPFNGAYVGPNAMEPEVAAAVFEDPTEGRVVGPLLVGDQAARRPARRDQTEQPTALRIREQVRLKPPEDRHHEQIEDAQPHEKRPRHVRHPRLGRQPQQREKDQDVHRKKPVRQRNEHPPRIPAHQRREERARHQRRQKCSREEPRQIVRAPHDPHRLAQ